MRSITIQRKITICKTLALSKFFYLTLSTVVPNHFLNELITLISEDKHGGLKCRNVTFKIISMQCSCVKRLYD